MPAPFTAFLIIASAALSVQASLLADEVLKDSNMKLPQYHLQVTQSSCSESNTCNLTCSAVVGHDATFAWYINGEHQATDGPGGSVGKHTIQHFGHIQLNNDLSFVYSTLVILEKADVTSGTDHVECRVMLLDEKRGRLAIIGLLAGSSLMFLLVLFVMGYYFHTHSYNPSSMFDRAGSTWEPGTTTLMRHKSISKERLKNAAAAATSVTPLEQTVLPPR
ncbi:hypothetical protein HPB50_021153 [Hyalomma asiaticum]|uniref:Uncharacterized protein n=1 Tax=Hyalomma asiaticum TaxID=266040 RepID=A0ACB7SA77_HYAAI|nr:hypothetical protein HPB50_021153 [Hyalomma asiaticum]